MEENQRVYNVSYGVTTYGDCKELVERTLSYFWDRLNDGGSDEWPEVEYLCDDMGITEEEMKDVFHRLGYDKEK